MSAPRHPNFVKLAKAHISEWAATTNLDTFGYPALHEKFKNKEYLIDGVRKSFYLELGNFDRVGIRHGQRVAFLIAKYLLLNGNQPTYCASLTELDFLSVARSLPRDVEQDERLLSILGGNGYLVAPQFNVNGVVNLEDMIPPLRLMETGDRLSAHVYDGGGLVLVGAPISLPGLQLFGALAEQVESSFEIITLRAKDEA